jgi:DNA replication protein DnaC
VRISSPEELLRTLLEAEIGCRDESNARGRLKVAGFPVTKTIDEFDLAASSVKPATFDYLRSLEWITARENVCLVGPAGTGKSHLLVALGHAAVDSARRVRYFTAADLVETLYRGRQRRDSLRVHHPASGLRRLRPARRG